MGLSSWWSSSSPYLKLVALIIPLVIVSGSFSYLGLGDSNWVFTSNYYPWIWSSSSVLDPSSDGVRFLGSNSTTAIGGGVTVKKPKQGGGSQLDWPSRLVGLNNGGKQEALQDEANFNRSSSPPLAVQSTQVKPPLVDRKDNLFNAASDKPHDAPSANVSLKLPIPLSLKTKNSELKRLEAGLGQARASIREANSNWNQTQDSDFIPKGPMYWNGNAFYRSYLEMEKQLKVFVYEEGEHPVFHNGPCRSIYAMEGNFIHHMEVSHFRTRDPTKAHLFFMPFSVANLVHYVYVRDSHDWTPIRKAVKDYVNLIAERYPYWNRSLGADHFMLACHDWGPSVSASVPYLFNNSIRALCNANTSEGFNPSKDVSIPELLLPDGTTNKLLGGPSPSKRPILVFFAGGLHGPVRPILLQHWENKDEDVQVHKYLPKGVSYYGMLRKSRYCICASGYEVASPRMAEALYTGCVPVLIKDHYVAPFSDVLNWETFSVEVAVGDIPNLKNILMGISQRQYIRLQRRGLQVRRHFEVNLPPKRFDVFHMTLHSIWLRRLNIRVRDVVDL